MATWGIDAISGKVLHLESRLRVGKHLDPRARQDLLDYLRMNLPNAKIGDPDLDGKLRAAEAYARTKLPSRAMQVVRVRITYETSLYADDLEQATQAVHSVLGLDGPEALSSAPTVLVEQAAVGTIPTPERAVNSSTGEVVSLEEVPYVPVAP